MTHLNAFRAHPSFIGFDRLFRDLETSSDKAANYPPYNIVYFDDKDKFNIEVAIAGFSMEDIDIELRDQVLTITGSPVHAEDRNYVHKGISSRKFKHSFNLAQYVEVKSANLANGILTIHLARELPDEKKPRKIAIETESPQLLIED